MTKSHSQIYLEQTAKMATLIDHEALERIALRLAELRSKGGRLFVLGVGGSASNSSHAVSDLRKLAGIEAYAPTDNVAELTARTNDEGWATVFEGWLKISKGNEKDAVLVLSVGGGVSGCAFDALFRDRWYFGRARFAASGKDGRDGAIDDGQENSIGGR